MALLGIEPIVDELITQLKANLPAKIVALQPTFAPVLPMPAVAEYKFGEHGLDDVGLKGFPALVFVGGSTDIDQDNARWQDYLHDVEIWTVVSDAVEENLDRLAKRYTRCIVETLCDLRAAGAFSFGLRFAGRRIEYAPTFTSPQGTFLGGSVLPVICHKEDTRP